jgi:O-antigen/teichoic acid export membrane protein
MHLARQLSREAVIYTAGSFVAGGVMYIGIPVYTRVLGPADFGHLVLVQTVAAILAGVLLLGGDVALARAWFDSPDVGDRRALVVTWCGFLALWSFGVALLCVPLGLLAARDVLPDEHRAAVVVVALFTLPLAQASRLAAQVLRNEFRPVAFAVTAVCLGGLSLSLSITLLLTTDLGLLAILLGALVAEGVILLVRLRMTRSELRHRPEPRLLPNLLRLGVPLVPVSLSYWVFTGVDRLVVQGALGDRALAYYGVATTLVTVFAVLMVAVGQAWMPRVLASYAEDPAAAARNTSYALTYLTYALGVLAVLVTAFAREVVLVIASDAYLPAAALLPVLMVGAVAFGTTAITVTQLTVARRTGRLAVGTGIAAVVNIGLCLLLVPTLGLDGAALASTVSYLVLTGLYLALGSRAWPVRFESRRLAVAVLGVVAVSALVRAVPDLPLGVRALLPVGYVGLVLLLGGVTAADRTLVRVLLTRSGRTSASPSSPR